MKPFVLLATRGEDDIADVEHAAYLELGGLAPHELVRVRLEQGPMPALDLDEVSGIIVAGSPFTSSDPVASKSATQLRVEAEISTLLDDVLARGVPYLGACYGVGTLGTKIGAVVGTEFGEEAAAIDVTLTDAGRADPLLAGLPDVFAAYVGHKEAITTLPSGAVVLATGAACPVQMFRVGTSAYATQFHPELTRDAYVQRLEAYAGYGYYPPEQAEQVLARARASDAPVPLRILRRFVELFAR
ncbi:glutamine amidotransferase [Sanguibacter sp. HDW7]|uniref:glutamine amidotransferase n=1 Tax=Sanguibacter sp. HDW7 TaxID=2714931 RepID=UPI0014084F32|nr:glutamine amidotransferase [Sanguibacter sp. HDW7]QIK82315.1 glutamine amidotransferase [Sanguibacter sp. HDW7]